MQREIKFRFYALEEKKMFTQEKEIDFVGIWILGNKRKTIMQYTGLKDKHGIEIYEGDILERDDDKKHLLTVIFKDGMFGFYDIDPMAKELYPNSDLFTVIASWIKYSKLIVVGNIYENPELLNKE